ncbi:MAG: hypothetical protein OXQ86_04800 [Gammaproteobacteria bacterium]|nr:hypothetical protein [Gammaproteobacteria bacterium]MDE0413494.1 hypothetical protein [Gammaproteobacteria bacterium]
MSSEFWLVFVPAVLVLALLGLRGIIKFDVNQWHKDRLERKNQYTRAMCPHADFSDEGGQIMVRSTYVSPPLQTAWQCQICGAITYDEAAIAENLQHWAKNPLDLVKRRKEMIKRTAKYGR